MTLIDYLDIAGSIISAAYILMSAVAKFGPKQNAFVLWCAGHASASRELRDQIKELKP